MPPLCMKQEHNINQKIAATKGGALVGCGCVGVCVFVLCSVTLKKKMCQMNECQTDCSVCIYLHTPHIRWSL